MQTLRGGQTKCIVTKPRRMLWKTFGETIRAVAKTEVVARSRPQPLSLPILRHHNNNVARPQPFSGPHAAALVPRRSGSLSYKFKNGIVQQ